MKISAEQQGDTTIMSFSGRLDGTTVQQAEQQFLPLVDQGRVRFVFDLTELEYISSAGLRFMLLAAKKTKAMSGRVALYGLTDNVREVFEISGFLAIFQVFESRDEAVRFAAGR
mgnify:CR=1 FL=1|jgi:anti-anti-sigma factor